MGFRRPLFPRRARRAVAAGVIVPLTVALAAAVPAAAAVPTGFTDTVAIGGLSSPTAAAFAPDGRVFVAEKSGLVKVFDSLADTTPTVFADLRTQTQDFWDRGLLGLAVDPAFPARPYVYVSYTLDAVPGGTAPRWGDTCPTPPGATDQGCVVTGRVSQLTMGPAGTAVSEKPLVTGWCQQFPSHSIGSLAFGPDGALYAGGGDGASFNFADYGQVGNPCADPPSPAGTNLAPPSAEGGALRSQSPRRAAGQPVLLNGTLLRLDPDTGEGAPGNPFASSTDANARRVIAYGARNQFRFGFRPGTGELWAYDVGWNTWEEINRVPNAGDAVAENFGWPCFEGTARQAGYDGANLDRCESLYSMRRADRAVLRLQPQREGRRERPVPDRRLVDQRDRVRVRQQLPGRVRGRAVLRGLVAGLHLGDANGCGPAEPDQAGAVRDRRQRAGPGPERAGRRHLLRRARER